MKESMTSEEIFINIDWISMLALVFKALLDQHP